MIPSWLVLDEASRVAGDLLLEMYGVAKKRDNLDPLDDHDFEIVLKQLFASLVGVVGPEDKRALQGVQTVLDLNWPGMSATEREQALRKIGKALGGVPQVVVGKVERVLMQHGPQIVASSKTEAVASYKLPILPTFNLVDRRVITAAARSHAHYVRNEYGRREEAASQQARTIVAHGLERGLDRYAIADELKPAMERVGVNRSLGYFRMVASVFAARARTWGTIAAFDEARIEQMEWVSMLDEVTSDVCRFLDGKVFPVSAARDRHLQVADAEDPEAVVQLQPWVSTGKTSDGTVALFYKDGGERRAIAKVERSGVGAKDDRGDFSRAASVDKLVKAGITAPPAHAHCRSQVVPASAVPSTVQVPAAIGPATTDAVVPYRPKPTAPVVSGAAATPEWVATMVRPNRPMPDSFNPEALPDLTAAEIAAAEAAEAFAKEVAAAMAKLNAWPPKTEWSKTIVLHPYALAPPGPDGAPVVPYKAPTKVQLAGAHKQKPKLLEVDKVLFLNANADKTKIADLIAKGGGEPPYLLVKSGGQFYAHGDASRNAILAARLLGKTHVPVQVVDLDKAAAKKAKKAPVVVPPPPATLPSIAPVPRTAVTPARATPMGDATNILHQKVAGAKGSNDGGFYKGADGVDRYVKFYDDPAQAHCEHLANTLYGELGHGAPASTLFLKDGKTVYASKLFEGGKTLKDLGGPSAISKDDAKAMMKAFVTDVLTGNWDAIGTGYDNVMRLPDGRWVRIDNGGTFLMRAKEGRKPAAVLNAITEWDVFFSDKNPYYKAVAAKAGYSGPDDFKDEVANEIRRVLALQKAAGNWGSYVDTHVPGCPPADRARIVEMLTARTKLLEERLVELTKPAPPPPAPGAARFLAKQYSTVLPRAGLKLADLPESAVIEDHYSKINRHKPVSMPSGERYADYNNRARQAVKNIHGAELEGIQHFTGSGYTSIRSSEESGVPSASSDAIQRALKKGTPEPGTVWRGIYGLPDAVVQKHLENAVLQLGKRGGATSSSSWCIDVSIDSFMGGPEDGSVGRYKILYKLHGKTQVPVETISAVGEGERELMFGRDAKFRITGLSRAKGRKYVLVVEAEEIIGDEAVELAPAPAAPATTGKKKSTAEIVKDLNKTAEDPAAKFKIDGLDHAPLPGKLPTPKGIGTSTAVKPSAVLLPSDGVNAFGIKINMDTGAFGEAQLIEVDGKLYPLGDADAELIAAAHLLGVENLPVQIHAAPAAPPAESASGGVKLKKPAPKAPPSGSLAAIAPNPGAMGAKAYLLPTPDETAEAMAKLGALPAAPDGDPYNPLVGVTDAGVFSDEHPVPVAWGDVPKDKKKAATMESLPVYEVNPMSVTLLPNQLSVSPTMYKMLMEKVGVNSVVTLVRAGGYLYPLDKTSASVLGLLHLLGKPAHAMIIDAD